MIDFKVTGIIVPPVTPFDDNGDIDVGATRELISYLISSGVHGIFPGGTTGEGPLLTLAERRLLAEIVVDETAGQIPVIIHTGAITTAETLELTFHARDIGAQAGAIIPPYYFNHTDEELKGHFQTIANEVPQFPIYLYNNPGVAANPLSVELVTDLVQSCPNIIGMKDSSGSLDLLAGLSAEFNGRFNAISGSDGLMLASLAMGFDACVSGNANIVPELAVALYNAVTANNLEEARLLQQKLNAVRRLLGDGADISLFKGILTRRGIKAGAVRAPLLQAPDSEIAQYWFKLNTLGLELPLVNAQ